MKKIFKVLILIAIVTLFSTKFTNVLASTNNVNLYINNSYVKTDVSAYISNSRTYVPIRFVAEKLNANSISWNQNTKTATIVFNDKTMKLKYNSRTIYINNAPVTIDVPVHIKNGRTFVPVRFISEQMGYSVSWEGTTKSVKLTKSTNQSNNYSQDDLYWLSRIVEAEAKGEPYSGKLAVANVIINRKEDSRFPSTIKSVIFDTKFGVQFTPISNGTIYNTPSDDSIKAAKAALEGNNNVGESLYFVNPDKSTKNWIQNNRDFYVRISNHEFYV